MVAIAAGGEGPKRRAIRDATSGTEHRGEHLPDRRAHVVTLRLMLDAASTPAARAALIAAIEALLGRS